MKTDSVNRGLRRHFPVDLAAVTASLSAIAVLYGGVRAFYFEGGFLQSFSYYSDETAFNKGANAFIGRDPSETLFGIHAFGDYLLNNVWASFGDPWVEIAPVNYLPPILLVNRILGMLPYAAGISLWLVGLVLCTLAPMVIASRGYPLAFRATLVAVLALLTGPAIATFDRGNAQGFLPILLFAFALAVLKQRWGWAAVAIALASLIKIYPIVLILLLLALRKYRWALASVAMTGVGVLVTLPIMATGGFNTLPDLIGGVLQFQEVTVDEFLQYNVSFAGGIANAAYLVGLPGLGSWVAGNGLVVVVLYAIATVPLLWATRLDLWIRIVLVLSLTTALMPVVYAYALNWVLVASALTVWVSRHSVASRVQSPVVTGGLMASLALGSALIPVLIPGSMEAGRPAGAVTLAALGLYVLLPLSAFVSWRLASRRSAPEREITLEALPS